MEPERPRGALPDFSLPAPRLENAQLVVPPFLLRFLGQDFILWSELRIDLAALPPDEYRVLVVQDFWSEDANPDLGQCLAAVFLARRRLDGDWEAPENWPLECRSVALIGHLDLCRATAPSLRLSAMA